MNSTNVWVVIAAYNEEQTIGKTVAEVRSFIPQVIVVDDYSSDSTGHKAVEAGAYVLTHLLNLGQGGALQTGIAYALALGAEYIVTFDADGQHCAEEIMPMLNSLQKSDAEVALGSRFIGKALNLSLQRKLLLKAAIAFTTLTCGLRLSDVHNGFRILSRDFCDKFEFTQNRMAHASEILNYIAYSKTSYIEYPVTIAYTPYSIKKGQKSSNALRVLMELFLGHISK